MSPMRICYVTSELAPLAKVGGLADVSGALPRELRLLGHDLRVYLPLYRSVRDRGPALTPDPRLRDVPIQLGRRTYRYSIVTTGLPGSDLDVQLVDCPALYDRPGIYTDDDDEHLRFLLLTRAAIDGCQLAQWPPDILHCHDWQAALAPLYLKTVYRWDRLFEKTRSVLTIHNLGYQGAFPASALPDLGLGEGARLLHQEDLREGRIGFLKTGLAYADALTTVSPTYAREIQTERLGMGLDGLLRQREGSLVGILNGVDASEWDPRTDRHLAARYSAKSLRRKEKNKQNLLESLGLRYEKGVPVVGIVTRLSAQKGVELLDPTGLDVSDPVMRSLYHQFYEEPRFRPSPETARRRASGRRNGSARTAPWRPRSSSTCADTDRSSISSSSGRSATSLPISACRSWPTGPSSYRQPRKSPRSTSTCCRTFWTSLSDFCS